MERCFETEQSYQEIFEEIIQNLIHADLLLPPEDNEADVQSD